LSRIAALEDEALLGWRFVGVGDLLLVASAIESMVAVVGLVEACAGEVAATVSTVVVDVSAISYSSSTRWAV
jgi:hypothetical protein